MTSLDYFIILTYCFFLVFIGFRLSRLKSRKEVDYLLAGRQITLPLFVMTLVATWYGGILGVGEFTYLYGISSWVVFGLPYYLWAFLFAIFLAPKIRKTNLTTIPEKLEIEYSRRTGLLAALLVFILVNPAPYFLILGILLTHLTGIPFWIAFLLGIFVSVSYVYYSGFKSVVFTDVFQFLLMFLAFALALIYAVKTLGGIDFLYTSLPRSHFSPSGGNSLTFILTWFFIALWTFVDPGFHQRCYAARNPAIARKGILISILFWLIFDFLTTSVGLYARAILPETDPLFSFPEFATRFLPAGLKGIFLLGLLATVMSTIDSYSFIASMTIGSDFLGRLRISKTISKITLTRTGLLTTVLLSIIIVWLIPSVVNIWYTIGSLVIPALLLPLLSSYFPRFKLSEKNLFLTMSLTTAFSCCWFTFKSLFKSTPIFKFEPMIAGLVFSILLFTSFFLSGRMRN